MPQKCQAVLFDLYGTLMDVHSVVMRAGAGMAVDLTKLSQLWRQKQLEFTWLRALMDRYVDFWDITDAALRTAVAQLSIQASEAQIQQLMNAYLSPNAFPEVKAALEALAYLPRGILSNGSEKMLKAAIHGAGMESYFGNVLSADQVKTYKPSPRIYSLGTAALGLPASDILFVSSNGWDAAGAKAFGFTVCWCNRSGQPMDRIGFPPDIIVSSLDQIPAHL